MLFGDSSAGTRPPIAWPNSEEAFSLARAGEGTLGAIVMNDELYQEVLRTVGLLTRSLEDYREAAPITSFTGVLFSAF